LRYVEEEGKAEESDEGGRRERKRGEERRGEERRGEERVDYCLFTKQMMNVFVHGVFQETGKSKRCFDRVFLLAPAPADSKYAPPFNSLFSYYFFSLF
jgi:hypothetical protein